MHVRISGSFVTRGASKVPGSPTPLHPSRRPPQGERLTDGHPLPPRSTGLWRILRMVGEKLAALMAAIGAPRLRHNACVSHSQNGCDSALV